MDLKKAIKEHGFTIVEVSAKLGITQSALSQQINNNTISFARVQEIANIIGVSLSELVADEGEGVRLVCPHCGKPISIELGKGGGA